MKNSLNTQETAPNLTESNLPKKSPFLVWFWSLIFAASALSIVICAIAIVSLTNTGRTEKDLTKQTTVATQETTPTGGNGLLTIALLGAGVASAVAIYKWRHNLLIIPKRRRSRRQQRRLLLKQNEDILAAAITTEMPPLVENQPIEPESTYLVTVLPPEEDRSSNLGEQSLAEMMDIRKHLSLSAILQDFKRPD